MPDTKVYLLLKGKVAWDINSYITVKDIADIYCQDESLKHRLEVTKILKTKDVEDWIRISSIDIINIIGTKHPDLDLVLMGEDEVLVEIKSRHETNQLFDILKVALIFILLFFGSGIAIINFHTDVDMDETMEVIYRTLSGKDNSNPLILSIPYSIGLGIGVITFFNRIISKSPRRKKEPGPMEIELYKYDQDMEEYIINDLKKE
ncbi:MAG: stage V sporulation protein AA [Tissierellaceae bacterium]|jgi:stage V sporulation protein AA|nr:stage V sporulation protein AA [Tissierellia bacterium]